MSRQPSSLPKKDEWIAAVDTAEARLVSMVGRWSDGIPAAVRAELREIQAPLLDLLMRAKLRR